MDSIKKAYSDLKDSALEDAIDTAIRSERKCIIYKRVIIALCVVTGALGVLLCF